MTSKPILFSGPMVRAILDGRKSQTRRVLKPQPVDPWYWPGDEVDPESGWFDRLEQGREPCGAPTLEETPPIKLPYASGDLIYVREAFSYDRLDVDRNGFLPCWFWADGNPDDGDWTRPKPSIHMPRWASRLTLEVTDVRIERVQDISQADAVDEGVCQALPMTVLAEDPRQAFRDLWDSLNAKRGYGWDANPWVCAVTFKAHHCNVDSYCGASRP